MIIRHNKERTRTNPLSGEFRDHLVYGGLDGRSNVVDRNDKKVFRGAGRRHGREKLRGRNRGHSVKFSIPFDP